MPINTTCDKKEMDLIVAIVNRVKKNHEEEIMVDEIGLEMDLAACHLNGVPLDLDGLLGASDSDFGHDVFGIQRYIDRKTGELMDCFLPRYALPA